MKQLHCVLLLIAVLGLGMAASAQQDPGNGAGERFFPMLGRVLTPGQRQSVLQILAPERGQIRPLEEKLRASRVGMLNQVAGGKFDENLAHQYAAQSAAAEAELGVIFARALSKMQPPLSAEQVAQLKNFDPGRFREARRVAADPPAAPEVHLKLPPSLPTDTNGLPIVN
ncbi:MAG TPA: periplasmic heavy metal sensor [Verrucomicrobiae bacterium]|jgi:Spy/CpxP family protein refolding chaperone